MLFDLDEYRFHLCPGAFDMRIGIWRLLEYMDSKNYDAHDKVAYMVCGKSRKCIKIVLWNNGYWLLQKHVARGSFCWPKDEDEARCLAPDDIERLLAGQDIFRRIKARDERLIF